MFYQNYNGKYDYAIHYKFQQVYAHKYCIKYINVTG